jgi:hypothetical protein
VHSFSTAYHCAACNESFHVEVTDLGDPYKHIPERSQEVLRRVRATENQLGPTKPGDPVNDLARELLEGEARSELRYATCPACNAKNPEGIAAIRADQRQTSLFGLVFFGIVAAAAWFYPWVALILPGMDLLVFRPIMVVQVRKSDKPFPIVPFALGIALDAALIALILLYPRAAPLVPLAGIVQSIFRGGSAKYDWKWEEARKKMRFEQPEKASS